MSKTVYFIELHVDEEWFKALSDFTADVHEGEICDWVRVHVEEQDDDDEDLTDDDEDETIEQTDLEENE
jgi:hypothetical protein